jgi:type IV pilus assembly protein PilY1
VDRAYVGDTKGRVWRMDIDDVNPNNWTMEKLADLGNFKFFFRPDVVITKNFDIVLLGSGDREKPLVTTSTDMFFSLHDTETGKDGSGLTTIGFGNLVLAGNGTADTRGYYLPLSSGEKVVNAPLSIGGVTYFSTNKPTPPDQNSCLANLGEARAYAVDFLTGGAGIDRNGDGTKNSTDLSVKLSGGGLPPSPVGGVVQLDDGKLVDFVIGSGSGAGPDANSAIGVGHPNIQIPKTRKKLYWNVGTDK